jgi:ribonuclease D
MNFNYEVVLTEECCDEVCKKLSTEAVIAVDTEFFVQKNIFVLSTIQIASSSGNYLFDLDFPLGKMPQSIKDIFSDQNILKIIHAHQQDVEILRRDFEIKIRNVFDTQIAMMFLSTNDVYSYQDLVKEFLKIDIEKLHKNDNWQLRPLTESQINYAIADVFYLYQIYPLVCERLEKRKRLHWMTDYMNDLFQSTADSNRVNETIKKYNILIENKEKYYRFTMIFNLLHELLPHNLLKNVIEAKNLTINKLLHIIQISNVTLDHAVMEKVIESTRGVLEESLWRDIDWQEDCKYELNYDESHIFALLKYFVRRASVKNGVASRLIANKKDLVDLIFNKDSRVKSGWRFEIFGKDAVSLLNGEKTIKIKDGKIVL